MSDDELPPFIANEPVVNIDESNIKHVMLMNNVANLLHTLYNNRLKLTEGRYGVPYSTKEQDIIAMYNVLISRGWKIKTLDQLDPDIKGGIASRKLKKLNKSYVKSSKKYFLWLTICEEFIKS